MESVDGASASVGCASFYPLKLLVPRVRGQAAWAFAATYGGGLVSGDSVTLEVAVGAGATAFLGSQATGKAYRSVDGGWCRQELRARVDDGALLAALPDPMCCFAGARFHQSQTLQLAPGGSAVLLDAYLCGREARGERWAFAELATLNRIAIGGEAVAIEALRLDGSIAARRLGRFSAIASLVAVGPRAEATAAAMAALVAGTSVASGAELLVAGGVTRGGGATLRVAAVNGEILTRFLRRALAPLAEQLGGDPWERRP